MKRNRELLCPLCSGILKRTPKYNEEGTIFKGNRIRCLGCGLKVFEAVNPTWKLSARLRNRQYASFQRVAKAFQRTIEEAFSEYFEEPVRFFPLTDVSMAYLLNLRAFTIKHCIPVSELCEMIAKIRRPYIKEGAITQRFNMALNRFGGMDLFGKLEYAIQVRYPNGENLETAKMEDQQVQIHAAAAHVEPSRDYREELQRLNRVRRILSKASQTRNYRGNPWMEI